MADTRRDRTAAVGALPMPQVEATPVLSKRCLPDGVQHIYRFPNGYAASVIQTSFSYGGPDGLWELAVLKGESLCYDTPITDDVLGCCDDAEVADLLVRIAALP